MSTYPGLLLHNPGGPPLPPVDREAPDPLRPCMDGCPHGHSCQSENMHAHKQTVQPPLKSPTTVKNSLFVETYGGKKNVWNNFSAATIKNDWKNEQATHVWAQCLQQQWWRSGCSQNHWRCSALWHLHAFFLVNDGAGMFWHKNKPKDFWCLRYNLLMNYWNTKN